MMAEFLSDAWLAEVGVALAGLPARGDASGVVQITVTGVPARKKVAFHVDAVDGTVRAVRPGVAASPTCAVTWDYAVAAEELGGRADPDVTFMLGSKKVEGDYAAYLLGLQPLLGDDLARAALVELAARTEVP
jgi:hypothetical protein